MRKRGLDWTVLVCVLVLCGLGTAIIGSVAPDFLGSQIIFYLFGLVLFFLFSRIDYKIYGNLGKQIYGFSLILLAVTLVLGLESRGATRWISLWGFRLQFSEILKPFLFASLAGFLTQKKYLKTIILAAIPVFLIFKQPDLGSALVYFLGFLAMLFVSEMSLVYLFLAGAGTMIFLPLVWHFLAGYQKQRILSFLNPASDPLGASYNAIQAVIAVGSGKIFGWGLGHGSQSQLLFLPEHHTDFVFASLAEELGFFGAGILLAVYFILIMRILKIAQNADPLGKFLAAGLGMMLLGQVFINVGMNLGVVPVTGITLPLVSYGGSSILATMISLGIVENIRRS